MEKCSICEYVNDATARFCGNCGTQLPEVTEENLEENKILFESKGSSKKIKCFFASLGIAFIILGVGGCIFGLYGLTVGYHTRMVSSGKPYVSNNAAYYTYSTENYTRSSDYPLIALYLIGGGICILGGRSFLKFIKKSEKNYVVLFEDYLEGFSGIGNNHYHIQYSEITGITLFSNQVTEGIRVNVGQAVYILYFVDNAKIAHDIIYTQRSKIKQEMRNW